jgi:hypothetical protein
MLRYVKARLGATRFTPLELSDVEIVEDVWKPLSFPTISSYIPYEFHHLIRPEDLITCEKDNPKRFSRFVYQLDPKLHIQSVHEVMYSDAITYDPQDMSWTYNSRDGIGDPFELIKMYDDIVIRDYFKDLFNARITWNELPMNKLEFMVEPNDITLFESTVKIATLNLFHQDTITMDTDMLPTIQKLLLADLMITIGQIRSKFNSLQTFYGTIEVNGQSMLEKGETLRQEAIQEFQDIPPREFFYFIERD